MNSENTPFKTRPIGFVIVTACSAIILALVVSLIVFTYFGFKSGLKEGVSVQTRELSTQIVYNYENYIKSIINASTIIQTLMNNLENPHEWDFMSSYFAGVMQLNSSIIGISVYDGGSGLCLASSGQEDIGGTAGQGLGWFSEALSDPTVHAFSMPYSENGDGNYTVDVSKWIRLKNGSVCVLRLKVSFQNFIDLLKKSNLGEGGHITIVDQNHEIVYTSQEDKAMALDEIGLIREIVLGTRNTVIRGYNMAVNVDTVSNTKWRICVFINIGKLNEIQRQFLLQMVAASAFILAAAAFFFVAVARSITRPIKQLEMAMRKVEKADYFRIEEVNITAFKEVNALARRFNKMMRKISELMERVMAEQNAKRRSELRALQNQINPHFLYNTLDSIIWLIENGKNTEANEMVVALAKLFRIGVSGSGEVITVRDELEHVRNYMLIQNIRYSDSFGWEFEADEEALEATTVRLVLQPIVENCLYHGLKNNIDRGFIKISARLENSYLLLSVADNGYGIRQETINTLYESIKDGAASSGVGLKNIYQRVKIYYGGDADLIIESELDVGTTITVKEPYKK